VWIVLSAIHRNAGVVIIIVVLVIAWVIYWWWRVKRFAKKNRDFINIVLTEIDRLNENLGQLQEESYRIKNIHYGKSLSILKDQLDEIRIYNRKLLIELENIVDEDIYLKSKNNLNLLPLLKKKSQFFLDTNKHWLDMLTFPAWIIKMFILNKNSDAELNKVDEEFVLKISEWMNKWKDFQKNAINQLHGYKIKQWFDHNWFWY